MQVKDSGKNRRGVIVLAVVCLLLQVMISPNVGMGNGRFNFALVFAGVYALAYGGKSAVVAGFLAGLVFDLISTGPIGLMSGLLTVFSYALGTEERNRFSDGLVAALSAFGVGSLVVVLVYHLAMILLGDATSVLDLMFQRVLPTFAMTFVGFLPFAYVQVRKASGSRGKHTGSKGMGLREKNYDVRNL